MLKRCGSKFNFGVVKTEFVQCGKILERRDKSIERRGLRQRARKTNHLESCQRPRCSSTRTRGCILHANLLAPIRKTTAKRSSTSMPSTPQNSAYARSYTPCPGCHWSRKIQSMPAGTWIGLRSTYPPGRTSTFTAAQTLPRSQFRRMRPT